MNIRALRISGIIVSGALIGGAVFIAMTAHVPRQLAPTSSGPAPAVIHHTSPPTAFAVSFRGDGPLARAQRLAMRGGRESTARRQVERALARQRAFRGLCFDHFATRGDVVLRACASAGGTDWAARLRAVPAVTNVDAASQLPQDGHGD
ncbi:MAG: hypothetical protein HY054_14360 [Proteobacteria bacterium]|nr:hypothetical protein [Pseudomonadota bacterium]